METFSLLVICAALMWAVYWAILRPTLINIVADELSALKSRVDWAIIENVPGAQTEYAKQLDIILNKAGGMEHLITFGQLVAASYMNRKSLSLRRDEMRRKFEESPVWLREAQQECARVYVKAALFNSPLWWPILPFVLFSTLLSNKASTWWQDLQVASSEVLRKNAGTQVTQLPIC